MIKSLLSPGLTPMLMNLLQTRNCPDPRDVQRLLSAGAGPWAVAKPIHEDVPARSLFYLVQLKSPEKECIDAWFDRAGDLSGQPWLRRGVPNPFHEMIQTNAQPENFTARLVGRLLQAGLVPTAPGNRKLGPWLMENCREDFPRFIREIATYCPGVILDQDQWEDKQSTHPVFIKLHAQAMARCMEQDTLRVAARPARRM